MAVETPQHTGLGDLLDYTAPVAWPPGTLVRVPLGRRTVTGVVWETGSADADAESDASSDAAPAGTVLRPVEQALTALPPLPAAWRALVAFAAALMEARSPRSSASPSADYERCPKSRTQPSA